MYKVIDLIKYKNDSQFNNYLFLSKRDIFEFLMNTYKNHSYYWLFNYNINDIDYFEEEETSQFKIGVYPTMNCGMNENH